MYRERKERQLGLASAKAIVAQAEALSQAGGVSKDPRLPAAQRIITRVEAEKAAEVQRAQERATGKRLRETPIRGIGNSYNSDTDKLLAIRKFCGPCDEFIGFIKPEECSILPYYLVKERLEEGICFAARVKRQDGTMTRTGFRPDQV